MKMHPLEVNISGRKSNERANFIRSNSQTNTDDDQASIFHQVSMLSGEKKHSK